MLIEKLDRTFWKLDEARKHVARQILACPLDVRGDAPSGPPWRRTESPETNADDEARRELLIALSDGDLHATGRLWEKFGAFVHQQLVWAKDRGILTRSYYLWQHEPCFFGWVRGNKPPRVSDD